MVIRLWHDNIDKDVSKKSSYCNKHRIYAKCRTCSLVDAQYGPELLWHNLRKSPPPPKKKNYVRIARNTIMCIHQAIHKFFAWFCGLLVRTACMRSFSCTWVYFEHNILNSCCTCTSNTPFIHTKKLIPPRHPSYEVSKFVLLVLSANAIELCYKLWSCKEKLLNRQICYVKYFIHCIS